VTTVTPPVPAVQETKENSPKIESSFARTIKKHDTIYWLAKDNKLPDEAWQDYQKYWRIQHEDGSFSVPQATNLTI